MSPPSAIPVASITSCTASGIVMKKRDISAWVTVTGPPRSIWRWKIGSTEPELPRTLPNRTAAKRVRAVEPRASMTRSARAFEPPMTVFGSTALSVEMRQKRSTAKRSESSASTSVPRTLLATAWSGFSSIIGTCL